MFRDGARQVRLLDQPERVLDLNRKKARARAAEEAVGRLDRLRRRLTAGGGARCGGGAEHPSPLQRLDQQAAVARALLIGLAALLLVRKQVEFGLDVEIAPPPEA